MPVAVGDEHVDGPLDAVIGHDLRRAKPGLHLKVIGDDRLAGLQGVTRRGCQIGPYDGLADDIVLPADTGADQQAILLSGIFQSLAELGLHAFRAEFDGAMQQGQQLGGTQGLDAEIREQGLLTQTQGQGG